MKIFLAGATGAIGKRLAPLLISSGHQVVGMTRTPEKAEALRAVGAQVAIADALDREAVRRVVAEAHPDAVIHEMTALASVRNLKHFDDEFALTNRLRTEGTQYLLAAAQEAGATRFVAQSYAGWPATRTGSRVKNECDPFDPEPPKEMRRSMAAIRQLEEMVSHAANLGGIVLRYGSFYGPGTSTAQDGELVKLVRKRQFPVFGDGAGVWSFIHIDDAAEATRLAVERGPAGVYNIVDDEPAEVSEWLPALAEAVGAKPPLHLPVWIGRLAIGEVGVSMMTKIRGASNGKAKVALGWRPVFASWRDGFRHGLSGDVADGRGQRGLERANLVTGV